MGISIPVSEQQEEEKAGLWWQRRSGCSWDFLQTRHLPPFLLLRSHFCLPEKSLDVGLCTCAIWLMGLMLFPNDQCDICCGSEPSLGLRTRTVGTGGFFFQDLSSLALKTVFLFAACDLWLGLKLNINLAILGFAAQCCL